MEIRDGMVLVLVGEFQWTVIVYRRLRKLGECLLVVYVIGGGCGIPKNSE